MCFGGKVCIFMKVTLPHKHILAQNLDAVFFKNYIGAFLNF